jgi:molybdate transport system substrate-binding protein
MTARYQYPAILVCLLVALTTLAPAGSVRAQVEPWECGPLAPATPQASPTASSPGPPVEFPAEGGELTVFAAASLTDAFTQMADDIAAANPNIEITFNFAGSQALVTQLSEGGAEADVLALASPAQMTAAVEAGIPVASSEIFARNLLTVVVPSDNPAGIAAVADLANDGVRLVLANPEVPAGVYARESLCKVASSFAADNPEYLSTIAANVVSEEENVRAVLTKVELGEADAGIVYVTDALTAGDDVTTIEISASENVVASYPIGALTGNALTVAFVDYVLSAEGQATLASFGFAPIG